MNRAIKLLLVVAVAFAAFTRATCGRTKPQGVVPVLRMTITDHVFYHNMGITFDGSHYFTINGGNEEQSTLNEYDARGRFVGTSSVGLDGRAIFWHADDEELYVKAYGASLYTADPESEESEAELEGVFTENNSSIGFSPDGQRMYELSGGGVTVYELLTGDELESFELSAVSADDNRGYDKSIAASDKYLFVWGESDDTVAVYDLSGSYVTRFELPEPGFGYSLSWANGMLWVAKDADGFDEGADGTWYGYRLKGLD